jgi:hypothetical protein
MIPKLSAFAFFTGIIEGRNQRYTTQERAQQSTAQTS